MSLLWRLTRACTLTVMFITTRSLLILAGKIPLTLGRYKNIVSMSAIAEANEAIELSDEDEIGPALGLWGGASYQDCE